MINENNSKLETLISNLNSFVFRCKYDKHRTMEYVSYGCLKITGYSPEEFYNKVISFNDLIAIEYRELLWNIWKENLSKNEHFFVEYPIITKSGKIKWVWEQGYGMFNEKLELLAIEGYITDITDRKNAEIIHHQESNSILKLLTNKAKELFYRYEFKPNPRFVYISPTCTEITGYTPEEYYADPFLEMKLVHLEDKNILESVFQNNFNLNKPSVIRLIKKNGEIIWIEKKYIPLYDKEGNLLAVEGIARDITEEKQREEMDKFINEYSAELISLRLDKIFRFITEKLSSFLQSSAIIICIYDKDNKKLEIKESSIDKNNFAKILELLGKKSKKEISFSLNESSYKVIIPRR